MIFESNSSKKVILFSSEYIPRFYSDVEENQRYFGLSIQKKKDIDEIVDLGITKPDQIMARFQQQKKEPKKNKLVSYLNRQRKKKTLYKISLGSLKQFCHYYS